MAGTFACLIGPMMLPERYAGFVVIGCAPLGFYCLRRAVPFFDAVDEARAREKAAAKVP